MVFTVECRKYSRLLWFCFTVLCDWLTELAPLSEPMRITKTNRALLARFFPRLTPCTLFASSSDWLIAFFAFFSVIGQSV